MFVWEKTSSYFALELSLRETSYVVHVPAPVNYQVCSLLYAQLRNLSENSIMRTLGNVVKIRKSFRFQPRSQGFSLEGGRGGKRPFSRPSHLQGKSPGNEVVPLFIFLFVMRTPGHMMVHRAHRKHKEKMKIKFCFLMAHRSHSKLKTIMKIKCFHLTFNIICLNIFYFTFILLNFVWSILLSYYFYSSYIFIWF